MNGKAEELIYRHFLNKFSEKTESCISAEIEMPVVNLKKQPVEPDFLQAMVKLLEHEFGFRAVGFTLDGFPIKAVGRVGDVFSFETSFNTIEFSMMKKRSVTELADVFYRYLRALKQLEKAHDHLICGIGVNPYAQYADPSPLGTPSMTAKSEFLRKFTNHHNGEIFHGFSASTQTHLDAKLPELPPLLNLLNGLAFADAILFANSLPFPHERAGWAAALPQSLRYELEKTVLCFRDVLWKLCEAPNTTAFEGEYRSVRDVINHLMALEVFIVSDGNGGYKPIRPVRFSDYFTNAENPEEDICCFRSLEPVAVSKHGTIEIRQTCTQPLSEIFTPVAFYAGIAENRLKALELVGTFRHENGLSDSGPALRRKAIRQREIAPGKAINRFIADLLAISSEGLKMRSLGEETYLDHLMHGKYFPECPAKRQLRLLNEGLNYEDILLAYGKMDKSSTRRNAGKEADI